MEEKEKWRIERFSLLMQKKLAEEVKKQEGVLPLFIKKHLLVCNHLLSATMLYELQGLNLYVIDGDSHYGSLTLVNIPALLQEDAAHLYSSDIGVFEAVEDSDFDIIYIEIKEKHVDPTQFFLDKQTLEKLVKEKKLLVLNGGRV